MERRCRISAAIIQTPILIYAKHLFDLAMSPDGPDLCAASDGDGDRNLIIGRDRYRHAL